MIAVLDNYISSRIPKTSRDKALIEYAASKISNCPTRQILGEIQRDLGVTERTLERLFENNIGVSPTQFRKIHQFNRAFRQLNTRQFRSLGDIAFEHGYADQSHYIRTFKKFTNITPKEYLHVRITS